MSLIKFNRKLPLINRFFPDIMDFNDTLLTEDLFSNDGWMPAINVKEHKKDFEIEVAAPGFEKKDFEVSITDDVLTIEAASKRKVEEKEEDFSRREFSYNSFKRSFTLPKNIDLKKKIKANYMNGILSIHLDKLETAKSEEKKKVIEIG